MKRLNRPLEVKAAADGHGTFEGYGSVYGVQDYYNDVVEPGAFAKSLATWREKGRLPALLWQHRADQPIGIYEDMVEDGHGLRVRGRLLVDDVALAREAYALIKAGAISGLSIGFVPVKESYDQKTGINRLMEIDIWETSLVTFPANEAALVTDIKTIRDFEHFLRDAGFSRSQAVRIASCGFAGRSDSGVQAIKNALMNNIKRMEI